MRIPERGDKVSEVVHVLLTRLKVIHSIPSFHTLFFLVTHLIYLIDLNLLWKGYDNTYTLWDSAPQ